MLIIANNCEFTKGPQMITSIRTQSQCSTKLREVLVSRLCQEVPFEDELNLIEAKCWGVNEQVNIGIYIRDLYMH
jgi:hypothetical protein